LSSLVKAIRNEKGEHHHQSPTGLVNPLFSSCMGEMHAVLWKLLSVNPLLLYQVDVDDHRWEVTLGLTEAWKTARTNIALAQKRQKV